MIFPLKFFWMAILIVSLIVCDYFKEGQKFYENSIQAIKSYLMWMNIKNYKNTLYESFLRLVHSSYSRSSSELWPKFLALHTKSELIYKPNVDNLERAKGQYSNNIDEDNRLREKQERRRQRQEQ